MVLTLVALVLLLLAVAAMVRSTDTSTSVIGNLAFRRDLTNRAELAIAQAKATLNSGGAVYSSSARNADLASANYSSFTLASPTGAGAIGVPAVLVSNAAYLSKGYSCMDGSGNVLASSACTAGSDGILIRWVIDRQCTATGAFNTAACGYINTAKDAGGTAWLHKPTGASSGLYRISVRISGPRNTEAYIQTTAG
jgi:hypothetical protein